jgi:predicted acetyltransferase
MVILEKMPAEQAYILQNLYPCYIHELSEFLGAFPNKHGLFESEDIAYYDRETFLKIWWQHSDQLFPFLIKVGDKPAGFVLITAQPFSYNSDFAIQDFFILNPYRKKGLAEKAAVIAFGLFHGNWKIEVLPKNLPACAFWRHVIEKYTVNNYLEENGQAQDGFPMVIFRFTN